MMRLRRWLFWGLTALSVLLVIGGLTAFIVCLARPDGVAHAWGRDAAINVGGVQQDHYRVYVVGLYQAQMVFDDTNTNYAMVSFAEEMIRKGPSQSFSCPTTADFTWLGINKTEYIAQYTFWNGQTVTTAIEDHWQISLIWPTLAGIPLPAIAARKVMKNARIRKRRLRGLCAKCGYDLRATPNYCPECGTVPDKT
jgi:hypothetical protein